MASITINGDTSGGITIASPAVAGTNTLTLPAATGTLITESMTLLGTLTTTSGQTQTLSGLDLTGYKSLFVSINRVSHNAGSAQQILLIDANGSTQLVIGENVVSGVSVSGLGTISLINGAYSFNTCQTANTTPSGGNIGSVRAGVSTYSTSSTGITFKANGGSASFDFGSISVYGVK